MRLVCQTKKKKKKTTTTTYVCASDDVRRRRYVRSLTFSSNTGFDRTNGAGVIVTLFISFFFPLTRGD
ncbi:hypothetical protein F2P81_007100 [Scophthalmus maximus]|uniref:Uncharacterized protein n=1 Tax=Scophthalmus maximus TaxID=52904 RepID=A0A6A4TG97_SCOMX|nr:hypothetical protein F2P81_007100 [Scophthalmus maximus]